MAEEPSNQTTTMGDIPQPEKTPPQPESENNNNNNNLVVTLESHLSKPNTESDTTFKQETTKPSDFLQNENKALQELKQLIQEALKNHEFSSPSKQEEEEEEKTTTNVAAEKEQQVSETVTAQEESAVQPKKTEEEKEQVETTKTEKEEEKETKVCVDDDDDDGAKTVEAIEETVVPAVVEKVEAKEEASLPLEPEKVSIWGIPLLSDERTDVILLKFLRARDFKVKEAFTMIKNTIQWRKEFGIEELLMDEKLGEEMEKVVYMHGFDKEGHPVCYNIFGEFQNKDLYKKAFYDEDKRQNFLRWRIQFLEKSIRNLDFNHGGICTIVQVNDLKNSPGLAKWELRQATNQALQLFQDNYPEFVAKQVFINVPWWYLAVNRMMSPFLTHRTKSKFVFAGPSKSAETLLRYIAPEQLPVKYGGLSKGGEFGKSDAVIETTIKPAAKHNVEFPVTEKCLISWEVRVIGWEVSYGAEFIPSTEGSYTVIIEKARKVAASEEEPVVCSSFKAGEAGKVVLTIDNTSSKKKKKLLYRLKIKSE